jgi:hypothetical protein
MLTKQNGTGETLMNQRYFLKNYGLRKLEVQRSRSIYLLQKTQSFGSARLGTQLVRASTIMSMSARGDRLRRCSDELNGTLSAFGIVRTTSK